MEMETTPPLPSPPPLGRKHLAGDGDRRKNPSQLPTYTISNPDIPALPVERGVCFVWQAFAWLERGWR